MLLPVLQHLPSVCGAIAPLSSIGLYMAPIPTIQSISEAQSVGDLPLLPYTSMAGSTSLWTLYGLLTKDKNIWLSNGIGLILSTVYFSKYVQLNRNGATQHTLALAAIVGAGLMLYKASASNLLGSVATIICLALFASPLAALRAVIAKKSADAIPLPFTLASLLNCSTWSIYGIFLTKDMNVVVTGLVGLVFGLTQMGAKLKYGNKTLPGDQDVILNAI